MINRVKHEEKTRITFNFRSQEVEEEDVAEEQQRTINYSVQFHLISSSNHYPAHHHHLLLVLLKPHNQRPDQTI